MHLRPLMIVSILSPALMFSNSMTAAAASEAGRSSREFNGVVTSFALQNPVIHQKEPLRIELSFKNISTTAIAFRYFAGIVPDAEIYNETGAKVPFKLNSPTGEYASTDVKLRPGETVKRSVTADIWSYYDLVPGRYYLQFRYDLRMISDRGAKKRYMVQYKSRDFVAWDTRKYRFTVSK